MKIKILIFILSLIIVSCSEDTIETLSSTPNELWQYLNIHNYTVEQMRSCFCPDGGEKVRITVIADQVISVVRLSDFVVLTAPFSSHYLTIDSLFAIIRNPKGDSLDVTYDSEYGYPNFVDINPQLHPIDAGVTYVTSNLHLIK